MGTGAGGRTKRGRLTPILSALSSVSGATVAGHPGTAHVRLACSPLVVDRPPGIGQLANLEWLVLRDNQLTTLPPEIGQLTTVPAEIERLPKLETLWVFGNPLDTASRALVQPLKARGVSVKVN